MEYGPRGGEDRVYRGVEGASNVGWAPNQWSSLVLLFLPAAPAAEAAALAADVLPPALEAAHEAGRVVHAAAMHTGVGGNAAAAKPPHPHLGVHTHICPSVKIENIGQIRVKKTRISRFSGNLEM